MAVSNGSYKDATGAAAWTIEGVTAQYWITGQDTTPRTTQDKSTYRSELFRLWGIMFMLTQITQQHQITQGSITIACNGKLALNQAAKTTAKTPIAPITTSSEQFGTYRRNSKSR